MEGAAALGKLQTLDHHVSRNDVLTAEVYWTLYAMEKHHSFKSFDSLGDIFQKMFPGCEAARKFSCGETKARYLATFGLAPYFLDLLSTRARNANGYVLLFDESLNHQLQKKQLDMHVRFWDGNVVKTHYFVSRFLGHATADNLFIELEDCCGELGKEGIVQLSMDGPNVNWATFDKLTNDIESETGKSLLNVGSCGLHIVHNAFKAAYSVLDWDIQHKLNSLYWLFKDSPAKREDFTELTGCSIFPIKFCAHRWLENVSVCKRTLQMWLHVKRYVEDQVKKPKCPTSKSFCEVRQCCLDPLFSVYLHIFISVAELVEPFLTKFQSDKPMLPYFFEEVQTMGKNVLDRFMKEEHVSTLLSRPTFFSAVEKEKDFNDVSKHKRSHDIDCGYLANETLTSLKAKKVISEREYMKAKLDTKKFLSTFVQNLLFKAPSKYSLVRQLGWIRPDFISSCVRAEKSHKLKDTFKRCLHQLVGKKRVMAEECDRLLNEYMRFVGEVGKTDPFTNFDRNVDRLDTFYFSIFSGRQSDDWSLLWKVIKDVLLLSHGQASVERGFSVNKQIATDNMQQKTLTALRILQDHISSVGGAQNIVITPKLVASASQAKSRYNACLEETRRQAEKAALSGKRKEMFDQLEEAKAKKARLEEEATDLLQTAGECGDKGESTGQMKRRLQTC